MLSRFVRLIFLPLILRVTRSQYLQIAKDSETRHRLPTQALDKWVTERFRILVTRACQDVEYYRNHYQLHDAPHNVVNVTRLPILNKSDVERNFPDRIVSDKIAQKETRRFNSGGTTHRIVILHDFTKRDWGRAAELLTYTSSSPYKTGEKAIMIPPDACDILCGVDGTRDTSVSRHLLHMIRSGRIFDADLISDLRGLVMNKWIYRRNVLPPFGPDGTHPPDSEVATYVRILREEKPTLLKALPEYLQAIAEYVKRTGEAIPHIPVVSPMGALMTPVMKANVRGVFDGVLREDYGCSELGPLAYECEVHAGLHLLSDHYLFEFIRDGEVVPDGELASLIITDLHNQTMPIIRYEIGDLVRYDKSPCPCGRVTPRITIEGRIQDAIVTPGKKVLTSKLMCEFFFAYPGISQFQLIERSSTRYEFRYVPTEATLDLEDLQTRFKHLTGDTRRFVTRQVTTILPEQSGKFRHVKSCSSHKFHTTKSSSPD